MKGPFFIVLVYFNVASATIFNINDYYESRDEDKIYKTNENVKAASQKLYDNYINFFKQTNKTKDIQLYSRYHDSALCLLSFLSYEEYNVLEAVIKAAEKDTYNLRESGARRERFIAIQSTYLDLEDNIADRDKYRSKCQFKIDQNALAEFKNKQKEELKTINENYDALMNIKKDTHPVFKKFIEEIERKTSKNDESSDEYKKRVFYSFANVFLRTNDILVDRIKTMFIGECVKKSNDLYLKKCANKKPYINIPGDGFRKKICSNDFREELKKCAFIE